LTPGLAKIQSRNPGIGKVTGIVTPTFQRTVDVYLDDVLIFSRDFAEYLHDLETVFHRIQSAGLKQKLRKCSKAEVEFPSHVVSKEGTKPDAENIAKFKNIPQPRNMREVHQFIGLAAYYRCFSQGFTQIAHSLNNLLKNDQKFLWPEKHTEAFVKLRDKLISPPELAFLDFAKIFTSQTETSNEVIVATVWNPGIRFIIARKREHPLDRLLLRSSINILGPLSHTQTGNKSTKWSKTIARNIVGKIITILSVQSCIYYTRCKAYTYSHFMFHPRPNRSFSVSPPINRLPS
jgi:hypothetical protein